MPRKHARPAAKKRRAKLIAKMNAPKPVRRPMVIGCDFGSGRSLSILAVLRADLHGAIAIDRRFL
ncbi:MAG: hypothetical protein IE919_16795 [Thioclava sp.]|nr:hypothetical protein [Thioclava sp.]MBD3804879.1 hypothetical protein [Thioclava sp.]